MTAVSATAIGGPKDRQTIVAVPQGSQRWTYFARPVTRRVADGPSNEPLARIERDTYRLERFNYGAESVKEVWSWEFWVYDDLTQDQAYKMLINGYGK